MDGAAEPLREREGSCLAVAKEEGLHLAVAEEEGLHLAAAEEEGLCLGAAEDGMRSCCKWDLTESVGGSGRSLVTGWDSSGVEFEDVLALLASRASRAFAARAFLCCFSADPPIVQRNKRTERDRIYGHSRITCCKNVASKEFKRNCNRCTYESMCCKMYILLYNTRC